MIAEESNTSNFDWSHLAAGAEVVSIWECLHDGYLTKAISNPEVSSAILEFNVGYLWKFHGLPPDTRFVLEFSGVRSLRITQPFPDSSGCPGIPGEGIEERNRRLREYHAKWHENPISWSAWETAIAKADSDVEVYEAELGFGAGSASVQIGGIESDSNWSVISVSATTLRISLSDGMVLSLEAFLRLGRDYWEAFAARTL
jgi:hypothetical protein